MDLSSKSRRELQSLCKEVHLKATGKNTELLLRLEEYYSKDLVLDVLEDEAREVASLEAQATQAESTDGDVASVKARDLVDEVESTDALNTLEPRAEALEPTSESLVSQPEVETPTESNTEPQEAVEQPSINASAESPTSLRQENIDPNDNKRKAYMNLTQSPQLLRH